MADHADATERFTQLIEELLADPAYGRGEREFPDEITPDEAADIAQLLHEQIDLAVADRGQAITDMGGSVACKAGCNVCCEQLIMVTAPEARVVSRWLDQPYNRQIKSSFLERYRAWRRAVGIIPERIGDRTHARDRDGAMLLYIEHYKKHIQCAFNVDGLCTIYEARPAACRTAMALDTSEYCNIDHPQDARQFPYAPLDDYAQTAQAVLRAAHHAVGGGQRRPKALCVSVYEELTGEDETLPSKAGRNEPCPCGSGTKFKRCCGR